jgi:hypothetical protein
MDPGASRGNAGGSMKRKKGTVVKHKHDGFWWVIDDDGYDVSYVGYDFKKDAIEALKIWRDETENDS